MKVQPLLLYGCLHDDGYTDGAILYMMYGVNDIDLMQANKHKTGASVGIPLAISKKDGKWIRWI